MPIILEVDRPRRLLMTTLYGVISNEDLVGHVSQTRRDSAYLGYDELVQSRGEPKFRVSEGGLRNVLATLSTAERRPNKVAIVVRTEKGKELTGLFKSLSAGTETTVEAFSTSAEALGWLRPDPRASASPERA